MKPSPSLFAFRRTTRHCARLPRHSASVFPVALAVLAAAAFAISMTAAPAVAATTTAADVLAQYSAQAGTPAVAARGQQLFTNRHGREWSCASCHGAVPNQAGKHAATGKRISALAPAADPERFTDLARSDKWFRRNCNDVMGRECSAAEKADVLSWLMTLKP